MKRTLRTMAVSFAASTLSIACVGMPALASTAQGIQTPSWFDGNRVQGHTRLNLRYLSSMPDTFFHAGEDYKKMGAHVFTRSIKAKGEGAWWPSAVGAIADEAKNRNLAKEIIDEAHKNGEKIIAYHRHMEDDAMAAAHPDWVCRNPDGSAVSTPRGDNLSFCSPYVDFYQQRSIELIKLGVDGFYFDESHQPINGDFSEIAKKTYKAETGKDAPSRIDRKDQGYQDYITWQNSVIARTFAKWRKAFLAVNPNIVMLISANRWNSFGSRHVGQDVFVSADSVKCEYNAGARLGNNNIVLRARDMQPVEADIRNQLAWVVARDVADGRPPHVWTYGVQDEDSALTATSAVLASGGIANLDSQEGDLPDAKFKSSFALGDKVSPTLAGSKPLKWVAIHYSESVRNQFATDEHAQWKKVLYPVYGAYRAAYRARLPVGLVFDRQLESGMLDGVKVIYEPYYGLLDSRSKAALDAFASKGGVVIKASPDADWAEEAPDGNLNRAFLASVGNVGPAPAEIRGGQRTMVSGYFTKGKSLIIALAGDSSWITTGVEGKTDNEIPKPSTKSYGPITQVRVVIHGDKPTKVTEVVSGQTLTVSKVTDGWQVDVPKIDHLAVLSVER